MVDGVHGVGTHASSAGLPPSTAYSGHRRAPASAVAHCALRAADTPRSGSISVVRETRVRRADSLHCGPETWDQEDRLDGPARTARYGGARGAGQL